MNTYYVKRVQTFESAEWGTQVCSCKTMLLRATVIGSIHSKRPMRIIWEWVCTGERIDGDALERLFRMYPVCEFQTDDDLMWRIKRETQKESP